MNGAPCPLTNEVRHLEERCRILESVAKDSWEEQRRLNKDNSECLNQIRLELAGVKSTLAKVGFAIGALQIILQWLPRMMLK